MAEAVALGQVGDRIQLLVGDVAWRDAGGLERQGHCHVAGLLVRQGVAGAPAGEAWVLLVECGQLGVLIAQGLVLRVDEVLGDAVYFGLSPLEYADTHQNGIRVKQRMFLPSKERGLPDKWKNEYVKILTKNVEKALA